MPQADGHDRIERLRVAAELHRAGWFATGVRGGSKSNDEGYLRWLAQEADDAA